MNGKSPPPPHIQRALSLFPPRPIRRKRDDRQKIQLRSLFWLAFSLAIFPVWLILLNNKIESAARRAEERRALLYGSIPAGPLTPTPPGPAGDIPAAALPGGADAPPPADYRYDIYKLTPLPPFSK